MTVKKNKNSQETKITKKANSPNVDLPKFFDKYPEAKARMIDYLKTVPEEQKIERLREFFKFLNGEVTWGEICKISKRFQKEIARIAYLHFKMQKYDQAEKVFKALAIVDHTNWYYRAALGAIYHKKKLYENAVDEYSTALFLREDEITSLVNRGECLMMLKDFKGALKDFDNVAQLNLPDKNPWNIRARVLKQRVLVAKGENTK
ncbi:MAG: hypothetical protein ABII18_11605 [bacterium]|nr:hypothetical protein [bacterium]MBU1917042.1 hypothetical protein [bacterium]